jgi:hypothetical protein
MTLEKLLTVVSVTSKPQIKYVHDCAKLMVLDNHSPCHADGVSLTGRLEFAQIGTALVKVTIDGTSWTMVAVDEGFELVKTALPSSTIVSHRSRSSVYPHTCPRCGAPAYVGFSKVDCSRSCTP